MVGVFRSAGLNYVIFLVCGNLQQFQQHLQPLVEERDWRGCVLDHLIRPPSLTYLHTTKIVSTLPEDTTSCQVLLPYFENDDDGCAWYGCCWLFGITDASIPVCFKDKAQAGSCSTECFGTDPHQIKGGNLLFFLFVSDIDCLEGAEWKTCQYRITQQRVSVFLSLKWQMIIGSPQETFIHSAKCWFSVESITYCLRVRSSFFFSFLH